MLEQGHGSDVVLQDFLSSENVFLATETDPLPVDIDTVLFTKRPKFLSLLDFQQRHLICV